MAWTMASSCQTLALQSSEPVRRRSPGGEMWRFWMAWEWPRSVRWHVAARASQTLTEPSMPPVTTTGAVGCHARPRTPASCEPLARSCPVAASQTKRAPSCPAVAAYACAGLKPTHSTVSVWPASELTTRPVLSDVRCAPESSPPVIAIGEEGWNARLTTGPEWKPCPLTTAVHSPDRGCHTRRHASAPAVTTVRPSGGKPPHVTAPECPEKTCMHEPSAAFHIQHVKSSAPASTTCPRGCHATHSTPPPGPSSTRTGGRAPVPPAVASHSATLPSSPAVASSVPSWLKATDETLSLCAPRLR
mmetsp:Transcript_31146/g.101517  ORF Transcript_31146/g.101517 Transcript_31146/m.101517 type:complete len:303 (-) Transcript_31146:2382-3290(-)